MTDIERVRAVCKAKKIPIHALEKALGYSNGYLNPKKAKTISYARLKEISAYLNVPISELLYDIPSTESKSPAPGEGEAEFGLSKDVIQFLSSVPQDRMRGILLALGAPEAILASLDRQEPPV